MKNQKKQFITLLIFFAFLLVAYITLQIYNENEAKKAEEQDTFVITEFTADEVVSFTYDYSGVNYSYSFSDESWLYDENTDLDMDESAITSMLNTAGSLLGQEKISEYASLDTYGLDSPVKKITVTLADGTVLTIRVGAYNEIVGLYYLMVDGDENLYLVDSTIYDTFEVSNADIEVVEAETEENTEEIIEEDTEDVSVEGVE